MSATVKVPEDAIVECTPAGIILNWNRGAETFFGNSAKDVVGKHLYMLVSPENSAQLQQFAAQILQGNSIGEHESVCLRKDGRHIHVWMNARVIRNAAGQAETIVIVLRNITERKRIEQQLRESEELFREIFAHAPFGMCVCGLSGRFIQVNNALCKMLGYDTHELLGLEWAGLVYPDDLEASLNRMGQLLKGAGECLEAEHRCIQRGGQVVWTRVRVSLVRDSSGSPLYFVAHVEDITDRRKAEQELSDSEERFRRVVEAAPIGIYIQTDGCFRYLNSAALAMFGAESASQIIGRKFLDLIHPDSRAIVTERARVVDLERKAVHFMQERHLRLDGSTFETENSAEPFRFEGRDGAIVFFRDLTERKQKEEALSLSEATQRSLVQNAPYGTLRSTPDGRILSGNPAICNMLGYSSEAELRTVSLSQIVYRNPWERSVLVERLLKDGDIHDVESTWTGKDGRSITVQLSSHASTDAIGVVTFESFVENITERKRSERELGRLNRAMSALSQCNEALVHATDEAQLLDQICEIVVRVGGYRLAWVGYTNDHDKSVRLMAKAGLDKGYLEGVHVTWDDTPLGGGAIGTAIKTGEPCVLRDIVHNPKFRPWLNSLALHEFASDIALPLKDEELRIGALTIYAQESDAFDDREVELLKELAANLAYGITALRSEAERKQAEQAVKRSEEKFLQLAENIREVIWMVPFDPNEKPYVSPAYEAIWGRSCGSIYQNPHSWMDAMHPDDLEDAKVRYEAELAGEATDSEYRIRTPDGQEKWIHDRAFPIRDQSGKLVRLVGLSEEITERKRYEAELIRSRKDAEAANRAKSEFLANMSHEIRTPMNGVLGMTELALDSQPEPEQREYLETIKSSADALLTVINDILDFSKIEAGKMNVEAVDFDLRQCMDETLRPLAINADRKRIEFLCEIAPDVPEIVHGDYVRLRQVLLNLVGNAIKFTTVGEVVVSVRMKAINNDFANLHFTVTDTGIGISPDKLKRIFDPFEQADTSTTRKYGGTGLGLTISARLVAIMGGRIWVDSELGHGSQFHFTVQMKVSQVVSEPRVMLSAEKLHGTRVLIVDDNATNRRILRGLLEHWGLKTTDVESAELAIAELGTAKTALNPYQLILTDMHMPDMDGFGLIESVRNTPGLSAPAIMMLTSGDHREDSERCKQLGVHSYIIKPIHRKELYTAILNALGRVNPIASIAPTHKPASTTQSLHILLAEDNRVNQVVALRMLEKLGHTVVVAKDGNEVLSMLAQKSFDLVLMDVQMPVMDGFVATGRIRESEKQTSSHIPIIAMTAHAMVGDQERCISAGMDGYISKPVTGPGLERVIAGCIQARFEAVSTVAVLSSRSAGCQPGTETH